MLPWTSPTKATGGLAVLLAGDRSPGEVERPTTGSDEGQSESEVPVHSFPDLTNPNPAPTKTGEVLCECLCSYFQSW